MYAQTSGTTDAVIAATAIPTTTIQKRFTPEPLLQGSHIGALETDNL